MTTVHVVGAGIAGLTAAHELSEHAGFEIHVHEASGHVGGKAASQDMTVNGVVADSLGEHGFRFFPWFYLHLPDTLKRIPLADGKRTVHDLLHESRYGGVAYERGLHRIPREPGPMDVPALLRVFFRDLGADPVDMGRYGWRLGRFWTACEARKMDVYEPMSWADYIGVTEPGYYTERFRELVRSIPLLLVAMRADEGSARTIGHAAIQLMVDIDRATNDLADAVLAAPTSHSWMNPWKSHLESRGVRFHLGRSLVRIGLNPAGDRVFELAFQNGTVVDVSKGHFVCALPMEGIAPLLPQIEHADPSLRRLRELIEDAPPPVRPMVGAQYALADDVPLIHGHVAFAGTDWALTAVSQRQFWTEVRPTLADYFKVPGLRGILSAIVSDWDTPVDDPTSPVHGKAARDCSEPEVLREIWRQMRVTLPAGLLGDETQGTPWLAAQLDRNVSLQPFENRSPLLVHPPGSYHRRPKALVPGVRNLALASDYVQTTTDIATMEGANEAGRRAAHAVLQRTGSTKSPRFFEFQLGFDLLRRVDQLRYTLGLPHLYDVTSPADLVLPAASPFALEAQQRLPALGIHERAAAALPTLERARQGDLEALEEWQRSLLPDGVE